MNSALNSVLGPLRSFMLLGGLVCVLSVPRAEAHGISESSRDTMADGGVLEYIWLGAEHMVTGYDHLLFLFGVIFFLTSFRDVVRFITAFTLGHCITLLGATLAGVTANAYLIDAVIAVSVIYKGFENLDGFKKTLGIQSPNLLFMVFVFGLIHGFGLSTRLQELTLGHEGLVSRILAFNVGVEVGQVAALTLMLLVFKAWRSTATFERFGRAANVALIGAGAWLFVIQIDGYLHEDDHHQTPSVQDEGHHSHGAEEAHVHEAPTPAETSAPSPEPADAPAPAEPEPDSAAPKTKGTDQGHSHGKTHSHGSGKPHHHGKTHSHGSGKPHSH